MNVAGVAKKSPVKSRATKKVRVWWPPTKNKSKSDMSGMFWPAKMIEMKGTDKAVVEYDNGDRETTSLENCQPFKFPGEFGGEKRPLAEGEYVEVSNNSKSDPAAWFARIVKVKKVNCEVEYPFCDGEPENKNMELIRRARIHDEGTGVWSFVDPRQKWKDGKFSSPMEAKLYSEEEHKEWLKEQAAAQTSSKEASRSGMTNKLAVKQDKIAKKQMMKEMRAQVPNIKKPARAKTAYLFFCEHHRPQVRAEKPQLSMVEVTKVLGEMWKKASEESRKDFDLLALADQKRHNKEMEKYLEQLRSHTFQFQVPHGFTPTMFSPMFPQVFACQEKLRKPTKPKSEYTLFQNAMKKQKTDCSEEAVAERWNNLSKEERSVYTRKADQAREVYEKKMEEYNTKKKMRGGNNRPPVGTPQGSPPPGGMTTQSPKAAERTVPHPQFQNPYLPPTQTMDMEDLRKRIKTLTSEDVYYQVIDFLRSDSPNFGTAWSAAQQYLVSQPNPIMKKPDVKGFLVAVFGIEAYEQMKKS
ncbi:hypothetical protein HOP50_02g16750 [Chloropicon primus]|uniref:HMG box domain-containing protein n=1 Tax=Chloropicon primus TaxID=1764295 RepID=A0A5B8MFS5_9CHLO|nr:hypothetical protein A3770_02p16790 [Chloropicon primus]UPQ98369.1 hypothetical protein HOP50_02g16750 [Chloropicon primus]|eukprot:QDZ19161.1 hypothetical protein A3770_02p16790 [Chloropicon primus]